jgi:hypothetical protein
MSVIGSNILAGASGQATGYNLTRSLRFRSSASANLSRTPSTASNRKTWTWSSWVKRGVLNTARQGLFGCNPSDGGMGFGFSNGGSAGDKFTYGVFGVGYGNTTAVYRDPSAWYHVVVTFDSTQATAANRFILNINNVRYTFDADIVDLNADYLVNSTNEHFLGSLQGFNNFDGYLAETHFIDGQALTPSSFGETNAQTGVWQPKRYAGTYGTNGFYLPFTDNSALTTSSNVGLGKDFSGNGNYWNTNNISITAGSTYDSMTDVPTLTSATASNFCTLNPLDTSIAPTNANLTLPASAYVANRATMQMPTSGKWYWESTTLYATGSNNTAHIGLCTSASALNTYAFATTGTYGVYWSTAGGIVTNGSYGTMISGALSAGDVLQCAYDGDTGKLYIGKNNTWYTSAGGTTGNPSAGTGETLTASASLGLFPYIQTYANSMSSNFGQQPFAYTPPTGFVALNTFNLPTPTIGATASTQAGKYFDVKLYTGNASALTVNGLGFSPDLVWIKPRDLAYQHQWYDTVRGALKRIGSSSTSAENTETETLKTFTSDGFTLGNDAGTNPSSPVVAWCWDANGSGSSNTAGSITSTVSANTSAGFSIVSFTGNGSSTATIGHGLGVAPKIIIIKNRDNGTQEWRVGNSVVAGRTFSDGNGYFLNLNTTGASTNPGSATTWGATPTAPTSTVFTVGSSAAHNENGSKMIAYCFAEVAGYSKFTSYTGNGSTDGPFLYLGFKPKYVLIKRTDTTGSWVVWDSARTPYNATGTVLYPNYSQGEDVGSSYYLDLVSNGIKIRGTDVYDNANGGTYIVMAFAEVPTKFSLAR